MLCPLTEIQLSHTVFVAFRGRGLNIECNLQMTVNQSGGVLTCSDPLNTQIFSYSISEAAGLEQTLTLELKNLTHSGEYSCQYKTAKAYWFLRVRGEYKEGENER